MRRPGLWFTGITLALGCALSSPPAAGQAADGAPPPAVDPRAELERVAAQLAKLDPKAPDYGARVKGILVELTRAAQGLARENDELRARLQDSRSAAVRPAARTVPEGPVVLFGKRGLTTYHRTGCRSGERIDPALRVTFPHHAAAGEAGYQACKICRPESTVPAPPAPTGGERR